MSPSRRLSACLLLLAAGGFALPADDAPPKELVATFPGHAETVYAVAVSPDGKQLLTASFDKTLKLFDLATRKQLRTFGGDKGHQNLVLTVAFAPDGQTFASGGSDNTVKVWDMPLSNLDLANAVGAVPLSNHGRWLLASARLVRVRKVADGPSKSFAHPNIVNCVAYNKDGTQLATACHDGIVRIWDIAKGTTLKSINAHTQPQPQPVYCVAYSPDGKQLATASLDRSIKIWDAAGGNLVKEIKGHDEKAAPKGHRDGVFCLAWTPDGKQLISGSSDRTIKMWNAADGAHVRDFANPNLPSAPMQPQVAHPGWVYHLRLTPAGQVVSVGAAPRNRGYVALWNPADGKLLYGAELPLGPFYHVAVLPDGQIIVACGPRTRGAQQAEAVLLKR